MGLQSRLLAGLAVLVFLAIASTGWLTLELARGRLEAAESERARALGSAAAGMLGAAAESAAGFDRAARGLAGVGGIGDVTVIDERQRPIVGEPGGDARLGATLAGATLVERTVDGTVAVYAPIRTASSGAVVGALRLRIAVSQKLGEAERGSSSLLAALTLIDGGLILLFGALFLRQVIRPLDALGRAAMRVASGDLEVAPLPPAPGELGALTDSFNRMTTALREQKRSLEASREQVLAQEKLATVGRLAAGVAHEVGNPLTAVLGYVDLLLGDAPTPAARDLLLRVKAETGRIHRIIHDLLDYARPVGPAGAAEEPIEPVLWGEVLQAAEGLLRPQPRFRDVALHNELPGSLPSVAGSSHRLVQVMLNLLLNAADAMGGTGVVRVTGRTEGDWVVVEVADGGPGVATAERGRIFDPFYTTKGPGGGTGLGLAVCRSIVQAFGGTIDLVGDLVGDLVVDDAHAQQSGATFRVTLPRCPVRNREDKK